MRPRGWQERGRNGAYRVQIGGVRGMQAAY